MKDKKELPKVIKKPVVKVSKVNRSLKHRRGPTSTVHTAR